MEKLSDKVLRVDGDGIFVHCGSRSHFWSRLGVLRGKKSCGTDSMDAVSATDCCSFPGSRSFVFGTLVFEFEVLRNGIATRGCGAVFAVGLVSYRAGRGKMAIFSLLLECKGRRHVAAELDISGKKRRYWRKGTDANGRNLSLAPLFHLCHNWNVVSLL